MIVIVLCAGCSRKDYRLWADRDAYFLLKTRESNPLWTLPDRNVEPNPTSRMADPCDPDCGPVPPDDAAAQPYMRYPYHSKPVKYWDKRGGATSIENGFWEDYLPVDEDGKIKLTKLESVSLSLIQSREFQDQVEQLYVAALGLSENRYEFALQWFGGNVTTFDASGDGVLAQRDLQSTNRFGFNRNLASGGQLAANLANSFVWQFGGGANQNSAVGNLLVSLTQPLLRGAFQHVRTESLTQSERNLLYEVRDFASFRRQFYRDIVSQYYQLLNQSQAIRIEEENLRNLRLSLAEHEELLIRELVSPIQVDQVYQSYQFGRRDLINAQQSFDASLDQFRFRLGLPARVEFDLDESILDQFQLTSPDIEKLQNQAEEFEQSLLKYLPPAKAPREFFESAYKAFGELTAEVIRLKPGVEKELEVWLRQLEETEPTEETSEDDRIEHQQQTTLATRIKKLLSELDDEVAQTKKEMETAKEKLENRAAGENDGQNENEKPADTDDQDPRANFEPDKGSIEEQAWETLQNLMGRDLLNQISTLFVAQTQIRLFLIEIKSLEIDPDLAVDIALENRLDLMNAKAQVVDSFRTLEVAANNLRSDLDVSASANLRTDPNKKNAFRFDGKENTYNVGIEFDGPLDRMTERNVYRTAQIAYQRQRRSYMATEDLITNEIRQDLRQLIRTRFNFQTSRQQLITAARQVDEAQFNLRTATAGDSSLTQDLLQALQTLTNAKNGLISSWVGYEISRIELFVDLELLMLDDSGTWINEQENILSRAEDTGGSPESDASNLERLFDGGLDDDGGTVDEVEQPASPESSLPFEPEPEPAIDGPELD